MVIPMAEADSNDTTNLSGLALQHQLRLDEIGLNLADIEQIVWVGIRATQDLRRSQDPAYYHMPSRDSEMLTFSLHDLLRRVVELGAELSAAAEADAGIGENLNHEGPSSKTADPVFAAIEAHKAAHGTWASWVDRHCKLESKLPEKKRRSDTSRESIVETDDPRWIEAERQLDLTCDAETDAAWALFEAPPTTRAGMLALLEHAVAHEAAGHLWPEKWRHSLLENLSEELPKLWQERASA